MSINIVDVTSILGKTATLAVPATATAIVTNAVGSNKTVKINTLYIGNVDSTNPTAITVTHYRTTGTVSTRFVYNLVVPVAAVMDIISKPIYLEPGDELRLTAAIAGRLEALCSYEEIS